MSHDKVSDVQICSFYASVVVGDVIIEDSVSLPLIKSRLEVVQFAAI